MEKLWILNKFVNFYEVYFLWVSALEIYLDVFLKYTK